MVEPPAAPTPQSADVRRRRLVAGIAGLALAVVAVDFIGYVRERPYTAFDDAYMFVRYADHLLAGAGMTWNVGGPTVYGVTSLGHLLNVVVARALFPYLPAGLLLTAISVAMALVAVVAMGGAAGLAAGTRLRGSATAAMVGAIALCLFMAPAYRANAVTGMGTMLGVTTTSLLIAATLWWTGRTRGTRLALLLVAAWAAFLVRPETLLAAAVFPPLARFALAPREGRGRDIVAYLIGLGAIVAIDTLGKSWIFGDPMPLAYYTKQHGFYDGYLGLAKWNPILHLHDFIRTLLPFAAVIALVATRPSAPILLAFGVPVLLAVAYLFAVVQIMGYSARYYLPFAPFVVVGSAAVVAASRGAWSALAPADRRRRLTRRAAIVVPLAIVMALNPVGRWAAARYDAWFGRALPGLTAPALGVAATQPLPELGWGRSIVSIARMLRELPDGAAAAMSEYGYVGARAPNATILDPIGLHDPEVAHNGFSAARLLEAAPVLIWFPHPDYARITVDILSSPAFWSNYDFFAGAFDYGLAVRHSAWMDANLASVIRDTWTGTYGEYPMESYRAVRMDAARDANPTR